MSIGARIPVHGLNSFPDAPPMEPGDQLTRDEFERRFDATPGLKRAELIEGVVYRPPAVRAENHGGPHADLIGCFVFYRASTPGVKVYDNSSIRLDLDNEPQPDGAMLIDPACGGQAKISADDYIEGAPEFVAEISASSVSIDLNAKFLAYRRNGVREYVVWRVYDRAIDHFVLRESGYELIGAHSDSILRSEIFPGLWLDTSALIGDDMATVFGVLLRGLASAEHVAFAALLKARRKQPPHKPPASP